MIASALLHISTGNATAALLTHSCWAVGYNVHSDLHALTLHVTDTCVIAGGIVPAVRERL
jgi:hypothetical protein